MVKIASPPLLHKPETLMLDLSQLDSVGVLVAVFTGVLVAVFTGVLVAVLAGVLVGGLGVFVAGG